MGQGQRQPESKRWHPGGSVHHGWVPGCPQPPSETQPKLRSRCRHSPRHGGHAPSIKKEVFSFSSKHTWMALSGSSPWRREKQAERTRGLRARPSRHHWLRSLAPDLSPSREAKRLRELAVRFCQHSWEQEESREAVLAARAGLGRKELGDLHGVGGEAWEGSVAARAVGVLTKPSPRRELRKMPFLAFISHALTAGFSRKLCKHAPEEGRTCRAGISSLAARNPPPNLYPAKPHQGGAEPGKCQRGKRELRGYGAQVWMPLWWPGGVSLHQEPPMTGWFPWQTAWQKGPGFGNTELASGSLFWGLPRRARSTLGEQLKQILCWTPLTNELPELFLISLPFCELSGTLSLCSCSPCSPSMVTVPLLLAMALGQFWPGWHTGNCAVPKTQAPTSPCPPPSKALSPNLKVQQLGIHFP